MAGLPNIPSVPGAGSRQQRAAELRAAAEARSASVQQQATAAGAGAQWHPVEAGETLESIAAEYGVSADQIWDDPLNRQLRERRHDDPGQLQPGDALYIRQPTEELDDQPVGQGDYVVHRGDCMSSIAMATGHFWETIWNDPANSELKEVREDPNVLFPRDRVTIPEKHPKQEPGETEMRHRFLRRGEPSELHLRILRQDNTARANEPYELDVDGNVTTGVTDADGGVSLPVPGSARRGLLTVGPVDDQVVYELQLGQLAPISTSDGVRDRLRNLGQQVGGDDASLAAALRAFQERQGLPATGQPDAATRDRLVELHGA